MKKQVGVRNYSYSLGLRVADGNLFRLWTGSELLPFQIELFSDPLICYPLPISRGMHYNPIEACETLSILSSGFPLDCIE